MPIFKEPFGNTAAGIAVERYRLINGDGKQVCILTYGGIIQMLQVADSHGKVADIILGFDTLQPYLAEHPYFGAIVGRYANRIAHGRFKLDGKEYQLATNNGPHHLHGGICGFDKQVWRANTEEVANACCVVLKHISADGDEGYPGVLTVEIKYTWNDASVLRIDYVASCNKPTIVNLTNHSYFNLSGLTEHANILTHRIQLNSDRYLPTDATLIPTGEQANVTGTCMDFRKSKCICKNMDLTNEQICYASGGYDHAWLLNVRNNALDTLSLAAIVDEPVSKRRMKIYTTQPAIQFYTGNFLDGSLFGKNNTRHAKYAGFCLETQHYPDAPNNSEFPSTVLRPDAIYQQSTEYRFDVNE